MEVQLASRTRLPSSTTVVLVMKVGDLLGREDGMFVGDTVGLRVGETVGGTEGERVGILVGDTEVGLMEGDGGFDGPVLVGL